MIECHVEKASYPTTLAMVSPLCVFMENNEIQKGSIGLVQFRDDDNFRAGIIGHEAVHCATTYMRLFEKDKLLLSDEIDENEERLAWVIGWFTKEITNFYYDIVNPIEDDPFIKAYPESE